MSVSLIKPGNSTPMPKWKEELAGDLQRMHHDAHCRSTLWKAGVAKHDRFALVNFIGRNDLDSLAEFFQLTAGHPK